MATIPLPKPTNNPVPSTDIRDHVYAGAKLDEAMTSTNLTFVDRKGGTKKTWKGFDKAADKAIAGFGYITLDSFEDGATITLPSQILRWKSNGEYYRWDGEYPSSGKVVPAGSTPESAGGVGQGKWLSVGAAALSSSQDGAGDALIAVKQPFNGSAIRSQHEKNADFRSVTDAEGCDPTGASESTEAFIAAGEGAYVPAGKYLVNTLVVNVHRYYGAGTIYTTAGQVIDLEANFTNGELIQKKMMEPFFGFNNGTVDTQIYTGAQYATQGMGYYRDPDTGVEKIFLNQSVDGTSWAVDDTIRIVEFNLKEDGSVVNANVFTNPLLVTHSHLSALKENSQLYLYSSSKTNDSTNLTNSTGKGWSKIAYKGAATANSDIQNFYVFGNPGSGHRYEQYGKGCVQVSSCGRYIIIMAYSYSGGGGRYLFVYDRVEVESMPNSLDAEPLYKPVVMPELLTSSSTAMQGEACDGKYIYALWGSVAPFGRRGINIHSLNGDLVRTIYLDGPAGQYTNTELLSGNSFGLPRSFEPEGITIRGGELLVNFIDYFGTATDIVSYQGRNFANTQNNNTGNAPNTDQLHWVETTQPANKGVWSATTVYGYGPANRRSKTIYAVKKSSGAPDEQALSKTRSYAPSAASFPAGPAALVYGSVPLGGTVNFCAHDEIQNLYRDTFKYHLGYTVSVFDSRDGSDNTKRTAVRQSSTAESTFGQVIAGDGTTSGGASVTLFTSDSAANPGEARLSSSGSAIVRLQIGTTTMFACSPTYVTAYQNMRFITDAAYNIGSQAYRVNNLYLVNSPVVSSDARLKSVRPDGFDDKVLDAWALVNYEQYAMLDEVYQSGDEARWHFGVIAQQVIEAFTSVGLDWTDYAVVEYEKWEAEDAVYEDVLTTEGIYDENGKELTGPIYTRKLIAEAKDAGDRYAVVYAQAAILEAALNRRERAKLEARLAALEEK